MVSCTIGGRMFHLVLSKERPYTVFATSLVFISCPFLAIASLMLFRKDKGKESQEVPTFPSAQMQLPTSPPLITLNPFEPDNDERKCPG
jgi:hypothetical protein